MSKYTVIVHSWVNGQLKTEQRSFVDERQALLHAQNQDCDVARVTDQQQRVIYQQRNRDLKAKTEVKTKKKKQWETYA